jgi:Xaa-Pro aminopeptidase
VQVGANERFDRLVFGALDDARSRTRRSGIAPHTIVDPGTILHELRLVKDADEIDTMRRAGAVTRLGHIAGMRATRPGLHEYELEAAIEYAYRASGAQDVAYPSIVAGGDNATILHYNTNREVLRDGDLVLVDSGAELDCYASDVTRTWPVNGRFSAEQRAIYEIVLAAQNESLALMRPGHRHLEVNNKAIEVVGRGLLKLGLVTTSTPEQAGLYLFHGTGHPLGLQTHDVYDRARVYEPGMVFTNEPGVYVRKDDILASEIFGKLPVPEQTSMRAALERYDGIGIRIEDDVLITSSDPKLLSQGAPRLAADIEALMAASRPR